jgi:tetratricopeptide (TPR) repeat protein
MELLDGGTLAELVRRRQRLEPGEAARLALQVADGLQAAHQAGLVHRDVKPGNVLLDASTGRAKLTDFGLARLGELPSGVTPEGAAVGTPAYMSPEQARGAAPDPRSDVYSLGVTLYEMLTGEPPFRGAPHLVLRQVLEDEPRSPRRLNDAVPRDLETVCFKALAKELARRYASAGELADDLRRWLGGEPVRARPAGPVERLWRWCRRRPLVAGLAVALLVALVTGSAGVTGLWLLARARLKEVERQQAEAQANFALALRAVDEFHTRVSENRLLNQPGLQPLRKELLETARRFYDTFVRAQADDPALQAERAQALARLAAIVGEIESKEQALGLLREALAVQERLDPVQAAEPEARHRLAKGYDQLGQLYVAVGRREEAETAHDRAWRLLQELTRDYPREGAYRATLAVCQNNRGVLAYSFNRRDDAQRAWEEAVALREALLRDDPGRDDVRHALAGTLNNLGLLYNARGEPARARSVLERAVAVLAPLAEARPDVAEHRVFLATCYYNLGEAYLAGELGAASPIYATAQAEAAYRRSLDLRRALADANPAVIDYQGRRAFAHNALGVCLLAMGKPAEAERVLREGLEHWQKLVQAHPTVLEFGSGLGYARLGLGLEAQERGDLGQALARYGEAAIGLETLLRREPRFVFGRSTLLSVHLQRGVALVEEGRLAEADAAFQQALTCDDIGLQHLLEASRRLCQTRPPAEPLDHSAVVAGVTALCRRPLAGSLLHHLGRVCAMCAAAVAHDPHLPAGSRDALGEVCERRAVACLARAAALRYYQVPARWARLLTEPALARLRSRTEFQAVVNAAAQGRPVPP